MPVHAAPARAAVKSAIRDPRSAMRPGFSFTEVLFAVMILGVGFIMIAAIFPVAIHQARSTSEEGNAAGIARSAITFIEQNCTSVDFPALGAVGQPAPVMSFRDPQWSRGGTPVRGLITETQVSPTNPAPARWASPDQLWNKSRGNVILAEDPRYAWVALYRRDRAAGLPGDTVGVPSPYAQVFIIVTQVRNRTAYSPGQDVATINATNLANLQPRPVVVRVFGPAQRIEFTPGPYVGAVGEGAYVIISNDNLASPNTGRMNGRIYRVGNKVDGAANTWELMPGNDFVRDAGPDGILNNGDDITGLSTRPANAFVVGKSIARQTGSTVEFEDVVQDIAVYTTFIQVR